MSLLTLLRSLESPTSGISVVVNPYSFSNGFSNGFEHPFDLLYSTYSIQIPLVSGNATSSINTTASPLNLSAVYSLIPSSIINGSGYTTSANVLSAVYNLQNVNAKAYVNIPANVLSAVYNINAVNTIGNSNVSATQLSATYNLQNVQANASSVINVDNLSATYNLQNVLVRSGLSILTNTLSASYNVNTANVNFGSNVYVDSLTGSYTLSNPQIINSYVLIPNILSASYNSDSVNVRGDSNVFTEIVSAAFNLNAPSIIEGFGNRVSATNISATYNLENISVNTSVKNITEVLNSVYNIESANIKGQSITSADVLNANYELVNPTLSIRTTATADILNVSYVIEDPNIEVEVNYTFSANVISGAYNLNNPEVIIAIPDWINDAQVPWNSYWRDDTECKDNERELYSTLITDTYNKFACVWVYYPTSYNITYDRVFKEDQNKYVIRAFSAMGFVEDIPAEHKSYNLEGIIGLDIVRAYFSIAHFTEASTYSGISSGIYGSYSPTVGDICYLTPNSAFYEVINVKNTIEQFMNRPNNYEVTMRVFKDNKMTVSASIPFTDPIYTVCSSAASATEQFHDYLAINSDVDVLISAIEYQPKPGEKIQDAFNGW